MKSIEERVFDLLYQSELTWNVSKKPLFGLDENNNPIETNSFGVFKSDGKHLGTVGEQYQIFQNHQMAEMIIKATDQMELELVKGGSFNDGAKVYLQVKLEDEEIGNSGLKRNITCLNSHDGSTSLGFGTTNTVVFCQNTYYRAFKDLQKIKHTVNMQEAVNTAVLSLKRAIKQEEELKDNFKRFADVKMEDSILARVIKSCFNIDLDEKPSTRKFNQISTVSNCIEIDVKQHGNNLWGLFNGITRYTNHHFKTKDTSHIYDGYGFKVNNNAYDEILSHVKTNTLIPVNI